MANHRVLIEKGQVYNRLTVLESIGKSKQGHIIYNCKCTCGNIKAVTGSALKRGEQQSCGCLKSENSQKLGKSRKGTSHLAQGQAGLNHLYLQYKHGAKKRNLTFHITKEQLLEITSKNCYYCNLPPLQKMNAESYIGGYVYNGIDRVDNTQGYMYSNCVACCKQCNLAKNTLSSSEFLHWIEQVFKTTTNRRVKNVFITRF